MAILSAQELTAKLQEHMATFAKVRAVSQAEKAARAIVDAQPQPQTVSLVARNFSPMTDHKR